jgi:hypothetical protein
VEPGLSPPSPSATPGASGDAGGTVGATWRPGMPRRPTVPEGPDEMPALDELPPSDAWPNIADYWPDAPQRMGPPADLHEDPAAAPTRIGAPLHEQLVRAVPPDRPGGVRIGRRRLRPLLGAAVAVLLLLGGGAVAYRKVADRNSAAGPDPVGVPAVTTAPPAAGSPAPIVVAPTPRPSASAKSSAPAVAGPATGTFWLVDDVSEITVSTARVSGGIARVGVPDGSDAVPRASTKGNTIRLAVGSRHRGRDTRIVVQLDSRISWAIRLGGGARQMTLNLGGATLRSVAFEGGAARIDLTLPRLVRTLPIRMSGGVHQWRIGTEGKVAVGLVARKGAGKVVLYGRNHGGLRHGERVSVNGGSGIDVDAIAGFGTLTVATT